MCYKHTKTSASTKTGSLTICTKCILLYTAFIIKEHFQIFGEMVQKALEIRKCPLFIYLFFFNIYTLLTSDSFLHGEIKF